MQLTRCFSAIAELLVVQWHLGFVTEDYTPTRRGFDSHYGYYTGGEDYFDHTYAGAGLGDVSQCVHSVQYCEVSLYMFQKYILSDL